MYRTTTEKRMLLAMIILPYILYIDTVDCSRKPYPAYSEHSSGSVDPILRFSSRRSAAFESCEQRKKEALLFGARLQ